MLIWCFHKSKECNLICSLHLSLGFQFCSRFTYPAGFFLFIYHSCLHCWILSNNFPGCTLLSSSFYIFHIFLHPFHATTVFSYPLQFHLLFICLIFSVLQKKLVVFTMLQNVKKKKNHVFAVSVCLYMHLRQTNINYTLLSVHLLLRYSRHFLGLRGSEQLRDLDLFRMKNRIASPLIRNKCYREDGERLISQILRKHDRQ